MKTVTMLIASVASLAAPWVQADAIANSPRTASSAKAVQLNTNVRDALTRFIAGCSTHDAQLLDSVTTDDVRIEYSLNAPGTYLSLDAISLADDCGINMESGSHIRTIQIYPTNDENVVFVEFDTTNDSSIVPLKRQLALIEMRGAKIARLLNFSQPANALLSGRRVASPSFTARAASRAAATGSE
jgi:hypothetical protein